MSKALNRLTSLLSGLFAMLRGPLRGKGNGAPKIAPGMVLSVLITTLGALVFTAAPAVAALEAPKVSEQSVQDVSSTSATLSAQVNPGGAATKYLFEYAPAGGEFDPVPEAEAEGAVPAGTNPVPVSVHVQTGLVAHTAYQFRLTATNTVGKLVSEPFSFATQPSNTASVSALPDSRVWELVSPAAKDGALIPPIELSAGIVQAAAEGGGAITYPSNGPLGANLPANADESQMLSVRLLDGGWSSQDIATPHEIVAGVPVGEGQEYRAFSSDLSVGLVEPFGLGKGPAEAEGAVPLSEGASEATPYLRADVPLSAAVGSEESAAYEKAVAEGGYLPLVTGCPEAPVPCEPQVAKDANVAPGVKFGGDIKFLGADSDLSHVVFRAHEPSSLLPGAEENNLYEWSAGKPPGAQLQLVSVLPDVPPYEGGQARGAAELGAEDGDDARGAVSSDGSRVVWSYKRHLFMRYSLDGQSWQTVQLDVGAGEVGKAEFQFANSDGSRVFFTDEERLTPDSNAEEGEPELYECEMAEVAGGLVCDLSDLTIAKTRESADVQGTVIAGGNESSYVYLVAKGALTSKTETNAQGKSAEAGKDNLYVLHYDDQAKEWIPTFIAVLSEDDGPDWAKGGKNLEKMTSRASPDGEYLAFMSEESLTGYDNEDVTSVVPGERRDEEVYLYGAPSAGAPSGRLVCVSCNPTGERPAGVFDTHAANGGYGLFVDEQGIWSGGLSGGRWLAGSVPGWTAALGTGVARYQSRYVSDSGRVFFDSPDGLVPQATNGLVGVYEYEPAGTVSSEGVSVCSGATATFSAVSDGCIGLISSGSAAEESVFLDASENGDDVFFLTSAQLVLEDKDTAFDVYDAHVCSSQAPCSTEPVESPACRTEAACKAAPTPQPTIFGAGPSETFSGAGNPVSLPPPVVVPKTVVKSKPAKCKKGETRNKRGKCVPKKKKAKRAIYGRRVK
jgi:hypothetical protein